MNDGVAFSNVRILVQAEEVLTWKRLANLDRKCMGQFKCLSGLGILMQQYPSNETAIGIGSLVVRTLSWNMSQTSPTFTVRHIDKSDSRLGKGFSPLRSVSWPGSNLTETLQGSRRGTENGISRLCCSEIC